MRFARCTNSISAKSNHKLGQTILTDTFLVIHHTYDTVYVGLFSETNQLDTIAIPHKASTARLIPSVAALLDGHTLKLEQLNFIGCTVGPSLFTTVRTVVVAANGLAFATGLPLVAINSLTLRALTAFREGHTHTVVLYNAFCGNLHYAVYDYVTEQLLVELLTYDEVLQRIKRLVREHHGARINYLGNGVALLHTALEAAGLMAPDYTTHHPDFPTLAEVAAAALRDWRAEKSVKELVPYYGKAYLPS